MLCLPKIFSAVKRKVFKGCFLLFTGIIPQNDPDTRDRYKKIITEYGGVLAHVIFIFIFKEYSKEVTHVICRNTLTEKYKLAKKDGKKIIREQWFVDCISHYVLLPESLYVI